MLTIVVMGAVVGAYVAAFAGGILMVRAMLTLRGRLRASHKHRQVLVIMTRAVLPGSSWRGLVGEGCLAAVETYRHRIWVALALMCTPLYVVGVVYSL